MLLPPTEMRLAQAFLCGDCDVEGDLEAATGLADVLAARLDSPGRLIRVAQLLMRLPRHDLRGSR